MRLWWERFWAWYERFYAINVSVAAGLFALQVIHLVWLFTDVVLVRLIAGSQFFPSSQLATLLLALVDYTEIPALFMTSLIYIDGLRHKLNGRDGFYLALILSQFLHIFWITDEFVISALGLASLVKLPIWLAWLAVAIDYLEVPVIIETFRRIPREGFGVIRHR